MRRAGGLQAMISTDGLTEIALLQLRQGVNGNSSGQAKQSFRGLYRVFRFYRSKANFAQYKRRPTNGSYVHPVRMSPLQSRVTLEK